LIGDPNDKSDENGLYIGDDDWDDDLDDDDSLDDDLADDDILGEDAEDD